MSETTDLKNFDLLKRRFWSRRALAAMSIMRQSKETGLLPRSEGWSNIIEHELVEAEAVDILAERLGLLQEERNNLQTAALLHDIFKRKEIERAKKEGPEDFNKTADEEVDWIRSNGYSEKIIELVGQISYASLKDLEARFDSISMARKIIYYVDNVTLGSSIVSLDERIKYVEERPEYKALNQSGKVIFGVPYTEVQRRVSRRIEAEFAPRLGVSKPSEIPEFIKNCINVRIAQSE